MDQTEVGAAGDAARRDIPRGPAQSNRGTTSVPQWKKSPGMIIYQRLYALCGRSGGSPQQEALGGPPWRSDLEVQVQENRRRSTEERLTSPQDGPN